MHKISVTRYEVTGYACLSEYGGLGLHVRGGLDLLESILEGPLDPAPQLVNLFDRGLDPLLDEVALNEPTSLE